MLCPIFSRFPFNPTYKTLQFLFSNSRYTKAIRLKDNFVDAYLNRGNTKQETKDYASAIKDYDKILLELDQGDARAYYNRGIAKKRLGQDEDAKNDFASAYRQWATEAFEKKQYQKAIKNYDAILKLYPEIALFYDIRGNAKTELGKSKASLGDLEDALKLYQAAIEDRDKAIELDPARALSYSNRGGTKFLRAAIRDHNEMIKDYQSAIQNFTKAIERKSDLVDAYNLRGTARCLLGQVKANQENSKEARRQYNLALEDFKGAINLDGDNASYYKGLGLANAALGKAKASIDAFEKAKQLEPESGK